jgi:hypothetical protein
MDESLSDWLNSMAQKRRTKIPTAIETQVLAECRRRCAFCYFFEKITAHNTQGQIAHIDRKRENHNESNLAYLCLPHHDAYDLKPSQSKRLSPGELRQAKSELLAYNRATQLAPGDTLSVTLTLKGDRRDYSPQEQRQFVIASIPQLERAVLAGISQDSSGTLSVTTSLQSDIAESICRDFNNNVLSAAVTAIELTWSPGSVEFIDGYTERNRGVPREQAEETVRSCDRAAFYKGASEVSAGEADLAFFAKAFGSQNENAYTVLVIVAIDSAGTFQVFGAVKAVHRPLGISSGRHPMEVLKAFLTAFGVNYLIPSLGSESLFIGARATVPSSIRSATSATQYWWECNAGHNTEACAVLSNVYKSEVGPFVLVRLVLCYARDRYLLSLGLKPTLPPSASLLPLD